MKRLIIFTIFTLSLGILLADLEINIPFSQNIVGDDHSEVGDYTFESEVEHDWITLTNTGSTTQTYSILYTYDTGEMPAGWAISVCNPFTCFMPFFAAPIELAPGAVEQIAIHIFVTSTGGFGFNITFAEGDLPEPVSLDFTFNTLDNVGIQDESIVVEESFQNYPNPFNPETNIFFSLTEQSHVNLEVYNSRGEKIKTLLNELRPLGDNTFTWDGSDEQGKTVASGLYFYKIEAGKYTSTKKMILMK